MSRYPTSSVDVVSSIPETTLLLVDWNGSRSQTQTVGGFNVLNRRRRPSGRTSRMRETLCRVEPRDGGHPPCSKVPPGKGRGRDTAHRLKGRRSWGTNGPSSRVQVLYFGGYEWGSSSDPELTVVDTDYQSPQYLRTRYPLHTRGQTVAGRYRL